MTLQMMPSLRCLSTSHLKPVSRKIFFSSVHLPRFHLLGCTQAALDVTKITVTDLTLKCSVCVYICVVSLSLLSGVSGNWIEIAYGTSSGAVRVIVQHPETVGSGPQLFQTFTVHRSPVTKIMLSEKHLVSGEEGVTGREI